MHLLEASTNQLGCVGWVHPKPLPTECGSLMGFAWVSLLATDSTTDMRHLDWQNDSHHRIFLAPLLGVPVAPLQPD